MTTSRGMGLSLYESETHEHAVTVTAFDRSQVEEVLNDNGIPFEIRGPSQFAVETDEVELVFDTAVDATWIQRVLDEEE